MPSFADTWNQNAYRPGQLAVQPGFGNYSTWTGFDGNVIGWPTRAGSTAVNVPMDTGQSGGDMGMGGGFDWSGFPMLDDINKMLGLGRRSHMSKTSTKASKFKTQRFKKTKLKPPDFTDLVSAFQGRGGNTAPAAGPGHYASAISAGPVWDAAQMEGADRAIRNVGPMSSFGGTAGAFLNEGLGHAARATAGGYANDFRLAAAPANAKQLLASQQGRADDGVRMAGIMQAIQNMHLMEGDRSRSLLVELLSPLMGMMG